MISVSNNLSARLPTAVRVFSGDPWIPTLLRKRRDGNPRKTFRRSCGPTRATTQFLGHLYQKANSESFLFTTTPFTLLTVVLRLDSSYEATTPPRLDLVLRQHVRHRS